MEKKNVYRVETMFKPNGFLLYEKVTAVSEEEARKQVEAEIVPESWVITGIEKFH